MYFTQITIVIFSNHLTLRITSKPGLLFDPVDFRSSGIQRLQGSFLLLLRRRPKLTPAKLPSLSSILEAVCSELRDILADNSRIQILHYLLFILHICFFSVPYFSNENLKKTNKRNLIFIRLGSHCKCVFKFRI